MFIALGAAPQQDACGAARSGDLRSHREHSPPPSGFNKTLGGFLRLDSDAKGRKEARERAKTLPLRKEKVTPGSVQLMASSSSEEAVVASSSGDEGDVRQRKRARQKDQNTKKKRTTRSREGTTGGGKKKNERRRRAAASDSSSDGESSEAEETAAAAKGAGEVEEEDIDEFGEIDPRVITVPRDYSAHDGANITRFRTKFPARLRAAGVRRKEWEHTVDSINEYFARAEALDCTGWWSFGALVCVIIIIFVA
jgi:Golgin subfamily A member 7/ERF4 family